MPPTYVLNIHCFIVCDTRKFIWSVDHNVNWYLGAPQGIAANLLVENVTFLENVFFPFSPLPAHCLYDLTSSFALHFSLHPLTHTHIQLQQLSSLAPCYIYSVLFHYLFDGLPAYKDRWEVVQLFSSLAHDLGCFILLIPRQIHCYH